VYRFRECALACGHAWHVDTMHMLERVMYMLEKVTGEGAIYFVWVDDGCDLAYSMAGAVV